MDEVTEYVPRTLDFLMPWFAQYAANNCPKRVEQWRFTKRPPNNYFHEGVKKQKGAFRGVYAGGPSIPLVEIFVREKMRACEVALRLNEPELGDWFRNFHQAIRELRTDDDFQAIKSLFEVIDTAIKPASQEADDARAGQDTPKQTDPLAVIDNPRYREWVRKWNQGYTEKDIGELYSVSPGTVGNVMSLLRKRHGAKVVINHK